MELPIELVEQTRPQPLSQRQKELLMLFYATQKDPVTPLETFLYKVQKECKFHSERLGKKITPFHPARMTVDDQPFHPEEPIVKGKPVPYVSLVQVVFLSSEYNQLVKQKPNEYKKLDIKMYF